MKVLDRNASSSQKCWCSNSFSKKRPKLGKKQHIFLFFGLGHCRVWGEVIFLPGEFLFNAELQMKVCFFEKISDGPRYGGLTLEWKLEGKSRKGVIVPKKVSIPFLDSTFNVGYDFAAKNDFKHDTYFWKSNGHALRAYSSTTSPPCLSCWPSRHCGHCGCRLTP